MKRNDSFIIDTSLTADNFENILRGEGIKYTRFTNPIDIDGYTVSKSDAYCIKDYFCLSQYDVVFYDYMDSFIDNVKVIRKESKSEWLDRMKVNYGFEVKE